MIVKMAHRGMDLSHFHRNPVERAVPRLLPPSEGTMRPPLNNAWIDGYDECGVPKDADPPVIWA